MDFCDFQPAKLCCLVKRRFTSTHQTSTRKAEGTSRIVKKATYYICSSTWFCQDLRCICFRGFISFEYRTEERQISLNSPRTDIVSYWRLKFEKQVPTIYTVARNSWVQFLPSMEHLRTWSCDLSRHGIYIYIATQDWLDACWNRNCEILCKAECTVHMLQRIYGQLWKVAASVSTAEENTHKSDTWGSSQPAVRSSLLQWTYSVHRQKPPPSNSMRRLWQTGTRN